ncbi:MAG: hypothetical protein B6242_09095 [Anaerolineaceae bacterium 4572_78]|nr:MAG: hypothetical protein B6242_09095 [Anaerolineaceae bacterium 4572_78]
MIIFLTLITESEIIKSAQKGSVSAFNKLLMTYQGLAFNIAYRIMGDDEAAADATQDGFIKVFKSLKQYRGGSFKSWFTRIVINTCYDHLRYEKRRPSEPLESDKFEHNHASRLVESKESPEKLMERHELQDMLQESISKLPENQRIVLVLSDVEGFNYKEIAEITNVQLGTVKSRLNRARNKLKRILIHKELLPAKYRSQE